MKKKAPKKFLEWLKTNMSEKGWGLRETARRAGLTHSPLSYIFNNGGMPSFGTCIGLAKAFDLPLETVLIEAGYLSSTDDNPIREEIVFILKRMDDSMLKVVLAVAREMVKTK